MMHTSHAIITIVSYDNRWLCTSSATETDMEKTTVEIFIAMNEDGDFVVVKEESEALEQLASDCGGYQARVVKLTVKMSPPQATEATVNVPDEAGETKEIEATA